MCIDNSLFIKIIVVGESGVGKTSLLNQYCYGKFDQNISTTIGCDFQTKVIETYKGQTLKLQLWDIAGQEKFKSITKLYVRGASGCVIVSDITNKDSLSATEKWKQIILDNCDLQQDEKPIPIILVQNKFDLVQTLGKVEDFMTIEYAKKFSEEQGFFDAVQVSAKNNYQLDEIFQRMANEIITRNILPMAQSQVSGPGNRQSQPLRKKQKQETKKSKCC